MKKYKILVLLFFIIFVLPFFVFISFKMGSINYAKHREIKAQYVAHPELLPNKETSKLTSFGFSNARADYYWLQAIQYIGANAIGAEYKKYLYSMIDIITYLNPYFEHPYIVAQLLLPDYNERYENKTEVEKNTNLKQAIDISMKGIENYCDKNKLKAIKGEYDLNKLWTLQKYKDPCKSSMIPYYLAYIYYFYAKDPINAAYYYKVTSANTDSLEGAKMLAAIMQGKGGDREKAIIMFLNMAKSVEKNELCQTYSDSLEKLMFPVFNGNIVLNGDLLKQIEKNRKLINDDLSKGEDEESALDDTKCISYINKSVREINLYYLDQANKKYFKEKGKNATNAKTLFDDNYIDYLPIDFQKTKDSMIIYKFDEETGFFDYEMGLGY